MNIIHESIQKLYGTCEASKYQACICIYSSCFPFQQCIQLTNKLTQSSIHADESTFIHKAPLSITLLSSNPLRLRVKYLFLSFSMDDSLPCICVERSDENRQGLLKGFALSGETEAPVYQIGIVQEESIHLILTALYTTKQTDVDIWTCSNFE